MTVQIKLKKKYTDFRQPKKIGISGDHNGKARKQNRHPRPIVRQLILVLGSDMKRRWEEVKNK